MIFLYVSLNFDYSIYLKYGIYRIKEYHSFPALAIFSFPIIINWKRMNVNMP